MVTDELGRIFRMEILPLLQEYFFEDWSRIQWILNDHRKPSEHRFLIKPTNDLATLFGEAVEVNDQCQRWVINEAAFGLPAAYSGIISADTNATT
jgi:5-methylcytosine-specific restriction protein B